MNITIIKEVEFPIEKIAIRTLTNIDQNINTELAKWGIDIGDVMMKDIDTLRKEIVKKLIERLDN
jgi:L-cysteine desulfidase